MGDEVIDESIFGVEREIKLFLSIFHIFQKDIITSKNNDRGKKAEPHCLSKYSSLSLLNIPISMKLFGHMTNI